MYMVKQEDPGRVMFCLNNILSFNIRILLVFVKVKPTSGNKDLGIAHSQY